MHQLEISLRKCAYQATNAAVELKHPQASMGRRSRASTAGGRHNTRTAVVSTLSPFKKRVVDNATKYHLFELMHIIINKIRGTEWLLLISNNYVEHMITHHAR